MEDNNKKYVLLRAKSGFVFWTLDKGFDYENLGCEILDKGLNRKKAGIKWKEYYND